MNLLAADTRSAGKATAHPRRVTRLNTVSWSASPLRTLLAKAGTSWPRRASLTFGPSKIWVGMPVKTPIRAAARAAARVPPSHLETRRGALLVGWGLGWAGD